MVARRRNLGNPLPGGLILISMIGNPQVTQMKNGKACLMKTNKSTLKRRRHAVLNTRKRRKPSVLDNETLGKPTATTNSPVFHVKPSQKRMKQHKL